MIEQWSPGRRAGDHERATAALQLKPAKKPECRQLSPSSSVPRYLSPAGRITPRVCISVTAKRRRHRPLADRTGRYGFTGRVLRRYTELLEEDSALREKRRRLRGNALPPVPPPGRRRERALGSQGAVTIQQRERLSQSLSLRQRSWRRGARDRRHPALIHCTEIPDHGNREEEYARSTAVIRRAHAIRVCCGCEGNRDGWSPLK
ncbi:hypothetical protein Q5P01_000221 [Channa striata]|uniref:Uncharacterized protein n=1 Tax=Channa striata TaxID=64152 RepID=A0AA88IJ17_CHASR|nr:hypothetical protein Q5P01_000221 [Channa striata]